MIINGLYGAMSVCPNNNKSINSSDSFTYRINAEFLNNCDYNCAGCFVKRKNSCSADDIDILVDIINKIKYHGMVFDELILGPTDIFAADNTLELFNNKQFLSIFNENVADHEIVLTILTTLQADTARIIEVLDLISANITNDKFEMEVLIPLDIARVYADDIKYIEDMNAKISLFNRMRFDVDFAIQHNISKVNIDDFSLSILSEKIKFYFDTILEFIPSFFRTKNQRIVQRELDEWNTDLAKELQKGDYITTTMLNSAHAGYNEITFNFKDGALYDCPFIYENIVDLSENFKVQKTDLKYYSIEDLNWHDVLVKNKQYSYTAKTTECEGCQLVSSCISKHVLLYMEYYDLTDCMIKPFKDKALATE